MSANPDPLTIKLAARQGERAELATTRTKEDIKTICERSLANSYARLNGTQPARYFLNETALPEHLLAVIAEFEVETQGLTLLDYIVSKNTPQDAISDRQKAARLKKLDEEIAKLEAERLRHAKAAALDEVERQFGGVAT